MYSPEQKKFHPITLRLKKPLETRYMLNRLDQDIFGFELVFYALLILNPLVILIDFVRFQHPWPSVYARLVLEVLLIFILAVNRLIKKDDLVRYQALFFIAPVLLFLFLLVSDYVIEYNYFPLFLPNVTSLFILISSSFAGLRFRHSTLLNLLVVLMYTCHANWLSSQPLHVEQMTYIVTFFILSAVISYLFERKNRLLFLSNQLIEGQKNQILKANDELSKQNEIKGSLMTILSHDIKAPLATLNEILNLKSDDFASQEEMVKHLNNVGKTVQSVNHFINHTILWIKSQMNAFEAKKETFNVKDRVEKTVLLCQNLAREKEIEVAYSIKEDRLIETDKEMFSIVFRNLLLNAIKFSHPKGKVSVSEIFQNGTYGLAVEDHGSGMSQEKLDKLFSVDSSELESQKEEGIGLGLPLSYNLMQKMEGELSCSSEEGKGTTFSMTFRKKTLTA